MSSARFSFARGNLAKLFATPIYLFGWLLAWVVPRDRTHWVFGSGIGVAEGALALARELRRSEPAARIFWAVTCAAEAEQARIEGFEPIERGRWAGFWATLRSRYLVVTHGLGDVNRFGVMRARVIHLGHGAPLKKLHLDSPVTTRFTGPAVIRAVLKRMYLAGSRRVWVYVAGSITVAQRLRSAYRVAPGRVMVLGDPRDDELISMPSATARDRLLRLLGLPPETAGPMVLYAPTWRDGDADPAVPNAAEAEAIRSLMRSLNGHLVIRAHRLGAGAYSDIAGERIRLLGADVVRDVTPLLSAFDVVVTDYSSIAVDFSLTGAPIVWFAPDLAQYVAARGLYEPLEVTAAGRVQHDWATTLQRLAQIIEHDGPEYNRIARVAAEADTRALAARFHAYPEGRGAARVLAEIRRLDRPAAEMVPPGAIYFESFYGRQVSCNPLAIDQEIAARLPAAPRYWGVANERVAVPSGAIQLLIGGHEWHAVRRQATLLVVNDWLRYGFRRRRGQTVLQTWHGTMLKHLALGRPNVGVRRRLAIHRESRRWSLLLSQNPHATEQFRRSYAYRGEIIEMGYPRNDRLARAVVPTLCASGSVRGQRIDFVIEAARRAIGVPPGHRVLVYAPTWRDGSGGAATGVVDELNVHALAAELNAGAGNDHDQRPWVVVARGHTRTHGYGGYAQLGAHLSANPATTSAVIDASAHPDVNDVMLAADMLVTDYSSVMFDAPVARVPLAFFVPDLAAYRDRERGFTFDFEATAPGPLVTTREQLIAVARATSTDAPLPQSYESWRKTYAPNDDGHAARRVVDSLVERGLLRQYAPDASVASDNAT